jgi:hypothetical protein
MIVRTACFQRSGCVVGKGDLWTRATTVEKPATAALAWVLTHRSCRCRNCRDSFRTAVHWRRSRATWAASGCVSDCAAREILDAGSSPPLLQSSWCRTTNSSPLHARTVLPIRRGSRSDLVSGSKMPALHSPSTRGSRFHTGAKSRWRSTRFLTEAGGSGRSRLRLDDSMCSPSAGYWNSAAAIRDSNRWSSPHRATKNPQVGTESRASVGKTF